MCQHLKTTRTGSKHRFLGIPFLVHYLKAILFYFILFNSFTWKNFFFFPNFWRALLVHIWAFHLYYKTVQKIIINENIYIYKCTKKWKHGWLDRGALWQEVPAQPPTPLGAGVRAAVMGGWTVHPPSPSGEGIKSPTLH